MRRCLLGPAVCVSRKTYNYAIVTSCRRASISLQDESRANPNPVRINEEVSLLSSEQATAYLLCGECEERFNSGGET